MFRVSLPGQHLWDTLREAGLDRKIRVGTISHPNHISLEKPVEQGEILTGAWGKTEHSQCCIIRVCIVMWNLLVKMTKACLETHVKKSCVCHLLYVRGFPLTLCVCVYVWGVWFGQGHIEPRNSRTPTPFHPRHSSFWAPFSPRWAGGQDSELLNSCRADVTAGQLTRGTLPQINPICIWWETL